jgi:hypothetical protein
LLSCELQAERVHKARLAAAKMSVRISFYRLIRKKPFRKGYYFIPNSSKLYFMDCSFVSTDFILFLQS